MDTKYINGIACRRIETGAGRKIQNREKRYGAIPLAWLKNLPGDSGKAKVITILWFLNAVQGGGWFSLSGKICREYGISASQRFKILASLEKSGHIELQRSPGKSTMIRLNKPRGWR